MSFNRIFQEKKAIAEIFYEIIYKRAEFTQNNSSINEIQMANSADRFRSILFIYIYNRKFYLS